MIEIVSATRLSAQDFGKKSLLGISLRRLSFDVRLTSHIAYENKRGLPEIFNERIDADSDAEVLVFIHDDVWIDDFFFADHIIHGLARFDVIGVAGNRRRVPNQPAWLFVDDAFTWDDKENLSGAVAHGSGPFSKVSYYGDSPADCELLDGVMLAVRKNTLRGKSAYFDPDFDFHFYDLDFCRTARRHGLRLGTWQIPITHSSGGSFGSPAWLSARDRYRKKWRF
jgi:GT2 family glycosyltransferase